MKKVENADTRHFLEVELGSLKILKVGYDQRQNLDKGRQSDPKMHRLFLTGGQYHKFVDRCVPIKASKT